MEYDFIPVGDSGYVRANGLLSGEPDALDLVGACGENSTDRVLIPGECLPDAFIDLKTGLAGAVLLKLAMYHVKAAAVLPAERIGRGKFYEMVLETNRGQQFRVFSDPDAAVAWLMA